MNRPRTTAVIVALTHPTPPHLPHLARFAEEAGPLGEVLLVDASGSEEVGMAGFANVRVVHARGAARPPALARRAALHRLAPVAFTTAQMLPAPAGSGP